MAKETPLQRLRNAERQMTSDINQGFGPENLKYIRDQGELYKAQAAVKEWRERKQHKPGVIW